jgi:hypothetical protein
MLDGLVRMMQDRGDNPHTLWRGRKNGRIPIIQSLPED